MIYEQDNIKVHIQYCAVEGTHSATLLGGEFANCDGIGNTVDEAFRALKIRLYQLRRKRDAKK